MAEARDNARRARGTDHDVYHHFDFDVEAVFGTFGRHLKELTAAVKRLQTTVDTQGAAQQAQSRRILMGLTEMQAALSKINDATNNIARDIAGLKASIVPGMAQADVDAVQAVLDTTVSKLEAIAADTPDVPPAEGGGETARQTGRKG